MEAIGMAGKHATSELESFHSEINRNAPKMEGFSYSGMISRYVLTKQFNVVYLRNEWMNYNLCERA
jgi:hypothetical protein